MRYFYRGGVIRYSPNSGVVPYFSEILPLYLIDAHFPKNSQNPVPYRHPFSEMQIFTIFPKSIRPSSNNSRIINIRVRVRVRLVTVPNGGPGLRDSLRFRVRFKVKFMFRVRLRVRFRLKVRLKRRFKNLKIYKFPHSRIWV